MKLLTTKQKDWFFTRSIKVGSVCRPPMGGFEIYQSASFSSSVYIDANPLTKSLQHELFVVKELDGIFTKVNWQSRPTKQDFYVLLSDLQTRSLIEVALLFIVCWLPLVLFNLVTGKRKEVSPTNNHEQ